MTAQDSAPSVPSTAMLLGQTHAMTALRAQIQHLAAFDTVGNLHAPTVLLQGETGTGKGLVAQVMHASGPRAQGPFLHVNCAALPDHLLEAELFGFEAGAFTDARRAKPGLFEAATRGTLFLDEVEALPLSLQSKLLTVVEDKQVRRLGAVSAHAVDVKLIAATQAELPGLVTAGRFRADLYHRLAVVLLRLPPLRERQADIVLLAQHFLRQYATAHSLAPKRLTPAAVAWLQAYPWPGNVRELSHVMERVTLLHPEAVLDAPALEQWCLPQPGAVLDPASDATADGGMPLDEPARLRQALRQTGGNVARAARLLGLSRNTMRYRMRQYGITRPSWEALQLPSAPPSEMPQPVSQACPHHGAATPAPFLPLWEQKPVAVLAIELTFPASPATETLDADPWTVAVRWERTVVEQVQSFGGMVLQRTTPLLTALFGVPRTLEQMPQRAVQAAHTIRRLVEEAHTHAATAPCPQVRQTVHLGSVLVETRRNDTDVRLLALDDTVALPIRLLGYARPGELLVSSEVGRQIAGVCVLQTRQLLPEATPAAGREVYTVVGQRAGVAPPPRCDERVLSRFVGRERDLVSLQALLTQVVEQGQGHMVGIVGDPGMGKSRLLHEFCRSLQERPVTYLAGHCLSYGSVIPYQPVRDLLLQHCAVTYADTPAVIRTKLSHMLHEVGIDPEEQAPVLLHVLGIPQGTEQLAHLSPEALQQRTFATLRQLYFKSAQQQPLVLAVENLHWSDATSQAYLASLVEHLISAPLLLLATYRPGYRPPWMDKSYVTQVALQPLSLPDSRSMVASIWPHSQRQVSLVETILARAEGNPLFLEELAWAAAEHRDGLQDLAVPESLQGALMARIDRLPEATRRVLHTAAVLGRTGAYWLLQSLWDGPEDLQSQVLELQRQEFLYEQVATEEPGYVFKHALIRDVAYECLPHRTRQALHAAAGHCLEARYAEDVERVVDLLAYHYARSAEAQKAVTFLTLCAEKAVRTHAHTEAAAAFEEALAQATRLPETERERRYLDLTLRQAFSWSFLGRFRDTLERLLPHQEVLERLADPLLAGPYYFRLALTYWILGEHAHAAQSAQRARAAAQRGHDVATLGKAYYVLALVAHSSGQFQQALADGQQAAALLAQTEEWHYVGLMHWILGSTYGLLGEFTPALEALACVATIGDATGDPRLRSLAAWTTGWILVLRGEWDTGIAGLQRGLDLATDPASKAFAANYLGFAYVEGGQAAQAIPLLQQAVEHFRHFRYVQGQGRATTWLGEAWLLNGDLATARSLAQQGLALSSEARYVYGIGLAQRALGRIAYASGALAEAEHYYLDALKTFATLSAQYELGRTHLALAELAYIQGKRDTASACLRDAAQVFRNLHIPTWLAQTQRLAQQYGFTL